MPILNQFSNALLSEHFSGDTALAKITGTQRTNDHCS
jgi:hypothetical protein